MPSDAWIVIWTRFSTAVDLCAVWHVNSNNCQFITWVWSRKARAILFHLVSATETLAMSAMDVKILSKWERRILKRILGVVVEQAIWIVKTDQELREPYKDLDMVADIKKTTLEWIGHVVITDQGRAVKKIFESEPEGSRKRGRPRLRWLEDVNKDLPVMKIKKWQQKAANREELVSIIKEAKAVRELLSQGVCKYCVCNWNENISCTDPLWRVYQVLSGNLIIMKIQCTAGVVYCICHLHHFWQH